MFSFLYRDIYSSRHSTKCLSYVLALTVSSRIQRCLCLICFCLNKSNILPCWRPIVEIMEPPRVMCVSSVACKQRFVSCKWNFFGTWKSLSLRIIIRTIIKRFMKSVGTYGPFSTSTCIEGLHQRTSQCSGRRSYRSIIRGICVALLLNRLRPFTGTWTVSDLNTVSG
jgi:hypothetical protein